MARTMFLVVAGMLMVAVVALWLSGEHARRLHRSTRLIFNRLGLRRGLILNAFHGYIYGRWTNQYVDLLLHSIFPRISNDGRKWWSDRYHGKVITHEQARAIISVDKDIPLRDLEQIIPYPMARNLVLKGPPEVVVFDCACRHARENPCLPAQVCMVIGQPFVDFVLRHRPETSRRLSQAEALDLLRDEHQRGHLHSAWFKDVLMNRFYAICNCCKCCCGGVEAMTRYGVPMMASSGYVAEIDMNLCTRCEICVGTCPFDAISSNGMITVNWNRCMGCSVCVGQCTPEAVTLVRDERKGDPLDVRLLTLEHALN